MWCFINDNRSCLIFQRIKNLFSFFFIRGCLNRSKYFLITFSSVDFSFIFTYDPIFKVLEDAGYEGYMVVEAEQDPAKANPLEYAIRARKFIAEKTGL